MSLQGILVSSKRRKEITSDQLDAYYRRFDLPEQEEERDTQTVLKSMSNRTALRGMESRPQEQGQINYTTLSQIIKGD